MNLYEAKTQLSRLVAEAEAGEDVVIARSGRPVVRLVPVTDSGRRPELGAFRRPSTEHLDAAFSDDAEAEVASMFDERADGPTRS